VNTTIVGSSERTETVQERLPATAAVSPCDPSVQGPRCRYLTRVRILQFLATPWVDKVIAALACYPCARLVYSRYTAGLMNIPRALFLIEMALFIATMLIRRSPVRITADPLYWLVAFLASYYGFLMPALLRGGTSIVPGIACNVLAVLGLWVAIFARLSLGRNIGLVPAQRRIVTGGAYRYVRHPIYTAHFLCSLAFGLSCYSVANAFAILLGSGLWVVKTFMEESFLAEDREYLAYKERVRWRWFPGL
jgi:protein-S-isoprenylcysteine O-methyltransferase Ste14